MTSGVPQGSILGPVLFAILVNDYKPLHLSSYHICYADNLTILHYVPPGAIDMCQDELDNIASWTDNNRLTINTSKTKSIVFSLSKLIDAPKLQLFNSFIETVKSVKLLGVTFTDGLTWTRHIDNAVAKARRALCIVSGMKRHGAPPEALRIAYQGYVFCHMVYAWPAICDCSAADMKRLVSVDSCAWRLIGTKPASTLKSRLDDACGRLMSSIEKHADHPLRQFFDERQSTQTRNKKKLMPPRCSTQRFKNSFIRFSV